MLLAGAGVVTDPLGAAMQAADQVELNRRTQAALDKRKHLKARMAGNIAAGLAAVPNPQGCGWPIEIVAADAVAMAEDILRRCEL